MYGATIKKNHNLIIRLGRSKGETSDAQFNSGEFKRPYILEPHRSAMIEHITTKGGMWPPHKQ